MLYGVPKRFKLENSRLTLGSRAESLPNASLAWLRESVWKAILKQRLLGQVYMQSLFKELLKSNES